MIYAPMLPRERLERIAKKLKIPVVHVVEYHRFMNGHISTKMAPATKKYLREKLSLARFTELDKAAGKLSKPKR